MYNVNFTGDELDLLNPNQTSPAGAGGSGALDWLGQNYLGLTEAAKNVACIFNPEVCAQEQGGNTIVVPQEDEEEGGLSMNTILIIAAIAITVLIVLWARS